MPTPQQGGPPPGNCFSHNQGPMLLARKNVVRTKDEHAKAHAVRARMELGSTEYDPKLGLSPRSTLTDGGRYADDALVVSVAMIAPSKLVASVGFAMLLGPGSGRGRLGDGAQRPGSG